MKIGRLLCQWDEYEIIQDQMECYTEENSNMTSEEKNKLFNSIAQDFFLFQNEWENLTDYLTELMRKKNPSQYWQAIVKNFGWRSLHGHKTFMAENGQKLLAEILPNTDCTFKIFNFGRGFAIQNFHHDSPTGKEWYYIMPVKESTYYKYK